MSTTSRFIDRAHIESAASDLLRRLELFSVPVNPVTVAERLGIRVYSLLFQDSAISDVLRKEDVQYKIYVNGTHHVNRMRYTVAHEIGHFVLHREIVEAFVDPEINMFRAMPVEGLTQGDNNSRAMETQANMFAAALLMPEELVRRELDAMPAIHRLAQKFEVSREAMGHRIANLSL